MDLWGLLVGSVDAIGAKWTNFAVLAQFDPFLLIKNRI